MGIGIALRGSGALWLASTALGAAREVPVYTELHLATYISIPEVPTPRGLLSPMRGMDVSSLASPRYLGWLWLLGDRGGRLPLFRYASNASR